MKLRTNIHLFSVSLLCLFGMSRGMAETTIIETFASAAADSSVPFGWQATDPQNTNIQALAGVPYQRFWRTTQEGGSCAVYFVASQEGVTSGQIKDLEADMIVRPGGAGVAETTLRGVVVRAQTPELSAPSRSGFWGYSLGFISVGERRGLYVFENPTGVFSTGHGVLLASTPLQEDLSNNTDYILRVSAQGAVLQATLLMVDEATELAVVRVEGATDMPGYFGLRSANANGNVSTYFRNLTLRVP